MKKLLILASLILSTNAFSATASGLMSVYGNNLSCVFGGLEVHGKTNFLLWDKFNTELEDLLIKVLPSMRQDGVCTPELIEDIKTEARPGYNYIDIDVETMEKTYISRVGTYGMFQKTIVLHVFLTIKTTKGDIKLHGQDVLSSIYTMDPY